MAIDPGRWMGRRWVCGVYECSDFVEEVIAAEHGAAVRLPRPASSAAVRLAAGASTALSLRPAETPREGDVALLRPRHVRFPAWHAGVWIEAEGGAVLHLAPDLGVTLSVVGADLESDGYRLEGIYTWRPRP